MKRWNLRVRGKIYLKRQKKMKWGRNEATRDPSSHAKN